MTGNDIVFNFDLSVEEDVDAELAHFAHLAQLGADKDARESAEMVLWRHLSFFPAFAELGGFFIALKDFQAVKEMLESVKRSNFSKDEALIFDILRLFSKDKLSSATLTALQAWDVGVDNSGTTEATGWKKAIAVLSKSVSKLTTGLLNFGGQEAVSKCFRESETKSLHEIFAIELCLSSLQCHERRSITTNSSIPPAASSESCSEEKPLAFRFAVRHLSRCVLLRHPDQELRAAVQMLHFISSYVDCGHRSFLQHIFDDHFRDIDRKVGELLAEKKTQEERIDVLLTGLTAFEALYIASRRWNMAGVQKADVDWQEEVEKLVPTMENLVRNIFSEIGGIETPANVMEFLHQKWAARGINLQQPAVVEG